jgi:hypothetical protein
MLSPSMQSIFIASLAMKPLWSYLQNSTTGKPLRSALHLHLSLSLRIHGLCVCVRACVFACLCVNWSHFRDNLIIHVPISVVLYCYAYIHERENSMYMRVSALYMCLCACVCMYSSAEDDDDGIIDKQKPPNGHICMDVCLYVCNAYKQWKLFIRRSCYCIFMPSLSWRYL